MITRSQNPSQAFVTMASSKKTRKGEGGKLCSYRVFQWFTLICLLSNIDLFLAQTVYTKECVTKDSYYNGTGALITSLGHCCVENVYISSLVSSIGESTFEGCSALKFVSVPGSVKNIGNRAFFDCPSLSTIILPSSLSSIGKTAFGSVTDPPCGSGDHHMMVSSSLHPSVHEAVKHKCAMSVLDILDDCIGPFPGPGFESCEGKIAFMAANRESAWFVQKGMDGSRCSIQNYCDDRDK
jgi:hypothetical protein